MDKDMFTRIRKKLEKTQAELSRLLGVSTRAVHSYEQGWRNIPVHVERQLLYLLQKKYAGKGKLCWEEKNCPEKLKECCPAYEFDSGDVCWFVSGTLCSGSAHDSWEEKLETCKKCGLFPEW